jgi:hypothetical protein
VVRHRREEPPRRRRRRRACAGKRHGSCPEYQDGKAAEIRTNVPFGVTLGRSVLTAVTGIFTRWASLPVKVAAPLPGGERSAVGTF